MQNKHMAERTKINVLLSLIVVSVVAGAAWWKLASTNPPTPVKSNADFTQAHWPHNEVPFVLPVNNYASEMWDTSLEVLSEMWPTSGALTYDINRMRNTFDCYPIILPPPVPGFNICSIEENNEWLALAVYITESDEIHIIGGQLILNDAYLNNSESEYSTTDWRNKMLCQWMGWISGAPLRVDPIEDAQSCMSINYDFKTVRDQQYPDYVDITNFKMLYDHIDDVNGKFANGKGIDLPKGVVAIDQFGKKTQSFNKGQIETYSKNLGNGYKMETMVVRK